MEIKLSQFIISKLDAQAMSYIPYWKPCKIDSGSSFAL